MSSNKVAPELKLQDPGPTSSTKSILHKTEDIARRWTGAVKSGEGAPDDVQKRSVMSISPGLPPEAEKEKKSVMSISSIPPPERTKTDEEIDDLVAQEIELQEKRRKHRWIFWIKDIAAKTDVFAAAHTMPKHRVCILVATIMIPLSILTITWDLLAVLVLEIPHLCTINAPAFILFINFIALPLAMYGFMMEYLIHEYSRTAIMGLICVIVHPILFLTRAWMEYQYNGYRNQKKLYMEDPKAQEMYEYPPDITNPRVPTVVDTQGHF